MNLRGPLASVADLARPWRSYLRYGVAAGILQQTLFIAGAAIAAYAAGRAALGASYAGLVFYLLGMVVIVGLQVRTPWLQSISFQFVANRVQVDLRARIFAAVDRLTPVGLAGRRSGDVGSIALADVETVRSFFAETLSVLIIAAAVPALSLLALAALSWPLALVLTPFLVLAAAGPLWLHHRARRRSADLRTELADLSAEVVDDVQGLREIVTFGAEAVTRADLAARGLRARRLAAQQANRAGIERSAAELLATTGLLSILVVGAHLGSHHQLRVTFFPPAVIVAAMAFGPITRLVDAMKTLGAVAAAHERIHALIDAPAAIVAAPSSVAPRPARPDVEYRAVRFRYDSGLPWALDGVSFVVAHGETVALVGHSGAGKTTCVNLLLRFLEPTAGEIAIGGTGITSLDPRDLHALVGVVPQTVDLFNTSIRENLTLGRPDASDIDIEAAARAAEAWEFIGALPDGLDTTTGERGVQLSGGQRQRLAIARAFLADPAVLVLDEPLSNLDRENERAITSAMRRLRSGRTTLVVAHRLSTVQSADRIVVLDHGRVCEIGTPDELTQRGGTFAQLFAGQRDPGPPRDRRFPLPVDANG